MDSQLADRLLQKQSELKSAFLFIDRLTQHFSVPNR